MEIILFGIEHFDIKNFTFSLFGIVITKEDYYRKREKRLSTVHTNDPNNQKYFSCYRRKRTLSKTGKPRIPSTYKRKATLILQGRRNKLANSKKDFINHFLKYYILRFLLGLILFGYVAFQFIKNASPNAGNTLGTQIIFILDFILLNKPKQDTINKVMATISIKNEKKL